MNTANHHQRHSESGNVLIYILLAVILIAALSYAVANSTRGNVSQLNAERARLYATEILENANIISAAVSQLRLRGVEPDELCFDHTSWGADDYDHAGCSDDFNKIYHPDGAGLTWTAAPSDAMDSTASPDNLYHFYGDNEVQNIGTTCGAAGCSDLILMVDELQLSVCQQINNLLSIAGATATPPTDTSYGETRFIGVFGYNETIADESGGEALSGKTEGCFYDGSKYAYYKVLMAR